jgi:hypothetical protein
LLVEWLGAFQRSTRAASEVPLLSNLPALRCRFAFSSAVSRPDGPISARPEGEPASPAALKLFFAFRFFCFGSCLGFPPGRSRPSPHSHAVALCCVAPALPPGEGPQLDARCRSGIGSLSQSVLQSVFVALQS